MAIDLLNVGLSLLSGAGGALLLEVWWKPRQARKQAAVLLRAEIQENRDFIQARLPEMDERTRIRRDLLLPKVALDAAVSDLGYFPLPLAQAVIRVYHEYEKILRAYQLQVEAFYETVGPKEPEERLTSNFRAARRVLAEHMQLGLLDSDAALRLLQPEAERSLWPGRRPRLLAEDRNR
jgi:hypothetical protein